MEERLVRNKNSTEASRALHQVYSCDPVIVLRGLFSRTDITL